MKKHNQQLTTVCVVALYALWVTTGQATVFTWDNYSGDSSFNTRINWDPYPTPPNVPGAGDTAIFDGLLLGSGVGNNAVNVSDGTAIYDMQVIDAAIVDMTIGGGTGKFDLDRTTGNSLVVGDSVGDTATLNLLGGRLDTYDASVAGRATFNVINPGSVWDSRWVLVSGDTLSNTAGIGLGLGAQIVTTGYVEVGSDTGSGRVVVDGTVQNLFDTPSLWTLFGWLDVGPTSTTGFNFGQVTLQDGGRMNVSYDAGVHGTDEVTSELTVRSGGALTVGGLLQIGSYATLELFDATSKITTGRFSKTGTGGIFDWTSGTLEITGDHLILDSATPDSVFGHDLTIGAGKRLIVSLPDANNSLEIGRDSAGSLTIQSGGTVESYRGTLGAFGGGNGAVLVDGAGSTWTTHDGLRVGQQQSGIGTLTVQNYGAVHGDELITIGDFEQAHGTVTVESFGRLSTDTRILVGSGGSTVGSLTVRSGGEVSAGDLLNVSSTGTVELLGGEINTGSFIVAPGGAFTHEDGTLTVDSGTFDPGTSSYTIDGGSPTDLPVVKLTNGATSAIGGWLTVGKANRGALEVRNGASFSAAYTTLAEDATSTGGSSLLVENASLAAGAVLWMYGNATVTVSNGAHVDVTGVAAVSDVSVGGWPGSNGTLVVQGHNSRLASTFAPVVGTSGTGLMRIEDGGLVVNSNDLLWTAIGSGPSANGTVYVVGKDSSGVPSRWTIAAPSLIIGYKGQGKLEIADGGQVTVSGSAEIGSASSVKGQLIVRGSESLFIASNVNVWQPGTVELDSAIITTGNFELAGGTLQGIGTVLVSGQLANAGVVSPGVLAPALSTDLIIVDGDYVQNLAGELDIEIGGTSPYDYDRLIIENGSASLNGKLAVSLIDTGGGTDVFQPSAGETFEILIAAGGLGGTTFATEALPTLRGGLFFGVLYNPNDVTLVAAGVLGDYNRNGAVDAADYVVWRNTFSGPNVPASSLAADGDGDSDVDQGDYIVWRSHFGQTAGSGSAIHSASASDAIPEPAAVGLLVIGGGLLRLRRHVPRRVSRPLLWNHCLGCSHASGGVPCNGS